MQTSELIKELIIAWFKYGNTQIDILTETHELDGTIILQTEQELREVSWDGKRIKLLPKGFT